MPTVNRDVAEAIRLSLISPNVNDRNGEPANVVDVMDDLSRGIWDASLNIRHGLESVAEAIEKLASALKQH
jgi:hypothetical protein